MLPCCCRGGASLPAGHQMHGMLLWRQARSGSCYAAGERAQRDSGLASGHRCLCCCAPEGAWRACNPQPCLFAALSMPTPACTRPGQPNSASSTHPACGACAACDTHGGPEKACAAAGGGGTQKRAGQVRAASQGSVNSAAAACAWRRLIGLRGERCLGSATVHPQAGLLTTLAKAGRPQVPLPEPAGQVVHASLRHMDMTGHTCGDTSQASPAGVAQESGSSATCPLGWGCTQPWKHRVGQGVLNSRYLTIPPYAPPSLVQLLHGWC